MNLSFIVHLSIVALLLLPAPAAAADSAVWFWQENCGSSEMGLNVLFDGKIIYQTSFDICRRERSSSSSQQRKDIKFTLVAPRDITWAGYLDDDQGNHTPPGAEFEGNIWQAGAEAEALILGVSFVMQNKIYMNTVHVAPCNMENQSEIEPGLVLRTFPISK